jgi:hypothetical protein
MFITFSIFILSSLFLVFSWQTPDITTSNQSTKTPQNLHFPSAELSGTITFPSAGLLFDIIIEYREQTGEAKLILSWECVSSGLNKQVIPSSALYPPATNIRGSPFVLQAGL